MRLRYSSDSPLRLGFALRRLNPFNIDQPGLFAGVFERESHRIAWLYSLQDFSVIGLEVHRHRFHEAFDALVLDRNAALIFINGDNLALAAEISRSVRWRLAESSECLSPTDDE